MTEAWSLFCLLILIIVGALASLGPPYYINFGPILIDEVNCSSSEMTLLECNYFRSGQHCYYGGGAGVRCSEERLRVKNISSATIDTPYTTNTVLISWELYSGVPHNPSSFRVRCFNQQHYYMELFVNIGTLTQIKLDIGDLFSSTTYVCCVSAIYYRNYIAGRKCTSTDMLPSDPFTTPTPWPTEMSNQPFTIPTSTQILQSNSSMAPASISSDLNNMRANINFIGGVLGSIIVILLLVLAVCGGALLYMLRSRSVIPKR